VATAAAVAELAAHLDVEMPIAAAVEGVLHRALPIDAMIEGLLSRPYRSE
jgi:glycerol-3-phosphate dehydrogenase (NAD(P)+)